MIVTSLSGGVYRCEGDLTFQVGFMADKVVMYGDSGSQMFSYDGEPTLDGLREAFPDRVAASKAALLHTRGVTDRRGFLEDVKRLHANGDLLYDQLVELDAFIRTCNCAPTKLFKKLFEMGYSNIVDKVRLYEETPLFKQTVDLFMEFLKATR